MASFYNQFHRFAVKIGTLAGSPLSFFLSVLVILSWGLTGPIFHFSDTWQLVINTGTTIVTFLMVFLIQNTQNRDMKAVHLKLDELIFNTKGARNSLIDLEDLSEEELEKLQAEFSLLRTVSESVHRQGHSAIERELKKRRKNK